jgi:hypothetical protein
VKPNSGDPDYVRKYRAAYFTLWAMGRDMEDDHDVPGRSSHRDRLDLNLDVTDKYEELIRTVPRAQLTVTLAFAAGNGRERKPVQYGRTGIEFRSMRLVVNPRPPSARQPD